jgi:hypothetical protein
MIETAYKSNVAANAVIGRASIEDFSRTFLKHEATVAHGTVIHNPQR